MVVRERLDTLLVQRGLFPTRNQAQAAIMAGLVRVGDKVVDKPGSRIARDAKIGLNEAGPRYVSRGALKLHKALVDFGVEVGGKVFIDVGASTGGFTQCLLKQGARRVIAVDVGYGQLAWNLRQDPRVQVIERRNIRYLDSAQLAETPDAATVDVSFISLLKVIPNLLNLLKRETEIIALVKPQFEIGKRKVEKGGLVKKRASHQEVLLSLWRQLEGLGLKVRGITYSPIKGDKGNMEFFLYLTSKGRRVGPKRVEEKVRKVVDDAHAALG